MKSMKKKLAEALAAVAQFHRCEVCHKDIKNEADYKAFKRTGRCAAHSRK